MAGNKNYSTIFKDEDILVVNKQPGIPVIPGRNLKIKSLVESLKSEFNRDIFVNHRIDRFTSGIVLFALNKEAHASINEKFANNDVNKIYQCIAVGKLAEGEHVIDKPIFIDSRYQKVSIKPKGKISKSIYKGLKSAGNFHKVEVKIETGRTHQVRVHMSSENLPILGDELYNKKPFYYLKDIKKKYSENKNKESRPLISRQALHAFSLGISHPISGEEMQFNAEWPKDMKACWNMLQKYAK
jgi:RluA family pseudouridine synthase